MGGEGGGEGYMTGRGHMYQRVCHVGVGHT